MKLQNKRCIECGRSDRPWFSKKRCKGCAAKGYEKIETKRAPIAKLSDKRKSDQAKYLKLRLEFLNNNQMCQVGVFNCSGFATDIHHTFSGKDRNKYFLDESTWLGTCRSCHNWVHENSKKARELGLLK